jgi:glycosyltransferase involved in cell wall biosynthesis
MTLGGFICIRNGELLDYSWREAAQSLLTFCDTVLICDSDSTDGTRQAMYEWSAREPKLVLANYPWPDPKGDVWFWPKWLNYARQHVRTNWVVYLDADEVFHESDYQKIRDAASNGKALMVKRLNFWRDAKHLIPENCCCGSEVIRVGPQNTDFPSDYPWPGHTEHIEKMARRDFSIQIYHYGFLRKREAFFRKAREVSRIWNGKEFDPRLEKAETHEGNWADCEGVTEWVDKIVPFTGKHPQIAIPWLRERGYAIADDGTPL